MDINIEYLLGRKEVVLNTEDIRDQIYNRRILITGAAGSIGKELIKEIIQLKPAQLCLADQSEIGIVELRSALKEYPEIVFELANITDKTRMASLFNDHRPQIVFHTAAYKHVSMMEHFPYEAINNNLFGTQILADLSVEYQVEKFVFVSTDKAVKPRCVMGMTKRLAELYIQSLYDDSPASTQFIVTRFGNVLASTGSVYLVFKKQIENGGPITVTHPESSRYFMTLSEASSFVMKAVAIGNGGDTLVFDMGKPVLIHDLAGRMLQQENTKFDTTIEIKFIGLQDGEKLHEELWNRHEIKLPTSIHSISRARPDNLHPIAIQPQLLALRHALETKKKDELPRILKEIIQETEIHPSFF